MKDGGSAFPVGQPYAAPADRGMTLRDWFAGQALTGLIDRSIGADWLAVTAYEIADEMMKARNEGQS